HPTYPLSLHDALPISSSNRCMTVTTLKLPARGISSGGMSISRAEVVGALSLATDLAMGQPLESGLGICTVALALAEEAGVDEAEDRKSTRLNSSHVAI